MNEQQSIILITHASLLPFAVFLLLPERSLAVSIAQHFYQKFKPFPIISYPNPWSSGYAIHHLPTIAIPLLSNLHNPLEAGPRNHDHIPTLAAPWLQLVKSTTPQTSIAIRGLNSFFLFSLLLASLFQSLPFFFIYDLFLNNSKWKESPTRFCDFRPLYSL